MKTLHADLFPETLLVNREGDRLFTTSLKVAEHFKKRHTHVLRAIENLLSDLDAEPKNGLSIECLDVYFQAATHPVTGGKGTVRQAPMYRLSRDGFALLAMGFTGREALAWKVLFLAAFRDMERQLAAQKDREANALYRLRPKWQPIAQHPELRRQQLIGLTGHRSPGSITACRRRMREVGLLDH